MRRLTLLALLAVTTALALAACGSSSKPSYCGDVSKLQDSVKNFSVSGGVSGVKDQLQKIESAAQSAVSSAKGDFPNETSAISGAVSKLKTDVKAIPSSPSPSQIATAAGDVKGLVDAVTQFSSATKSKCS